MRFKRTCAALAALAVAASACAGDEAGSEESPAAAETEDGDGGEDWPETITYGILPTEDQDEMAARYDPLEDFLAECLDHPVEMFMATNYVSIIEAMRTDSIHIAKFGPFSYIVGNERAGAEAFVTGTSDPDDATYTAVFFSLDDSGIEAVEDLEGETFGFVDAASASGHLFPRSHMIDALETTDEELESTLGDVVFTGSHEASIMSVLNGEVAAAVVSSNLYDTETRMTESFGDHPRVDDLVEIGRTEEIPRALEAYQGDLPEDLKERASECFQDVVNQDELGEFLEMSAYEAGFVPVDDATFDVVRQAAEDLGMSPEELLEE